MGFVDIVRKSWRRWSQCVCVCVCEREREREGRRGIRGEGLWIREENLTYLMGLDLF